MPHPDKNMIALGIRQPWAELILRGTKTIEVRSTHTAQRGAIYVYASKKFGGIAAADHAIVSHRLDEAALPRGQIVGTVEIVDCRPCEPADAAATCVPASYLENHFSWMLANPQRFDEPLIVRFLPYGVWFYPWKRRNGRSRRDSKRPM